MILGAKKGVMLFFCFVHIAKLYVLKFSSDFFVESLGGLENLPYFCIAIGTQGSLAKAQRA